jgi:hypothetical protein
MACTWVGIITYAKRSISDFALYVLKASMMISEMDSSLKIGFHPQMLAVMKYRFESSWIDL